MFFFFSVGICFWLAVLLMAWDQTTLQNVRPPVLVGRRFPVMPRQKNGWTTRIYRNTSEDPELLKKRTLSKFQGNWHGITNWEHFFTSPDRDDPPPPLPHTHTRFWVAIRTTRKSSCLRSKDCAFFLRYLKTTIEYWSGPWNQTRNLKLPLCKKDRGAKWAIFPIIWLNLLAVGFKIVLSYFFSFIFITLSRLNAKPQSWK